MHLFYLLVHVMTLLAIGLGEEGLKQFCLYTAILGFASSSRVQTACSIFTHIFDSQGWVYETGLEVNPLEMLLSTTTTRAANTE